MITTRTIEFPPIYFKDKSTDGINKAFQNKATPITKLQTAEAQPSTIPLDKYNELANQMHENVK
jgi:hypothetical protein